jgi:hypothetical protein
MAVIEGVLVCSNRECMGEYPIIDGVPIIVSDLRTYVSQNIMPILSRSDLSETMETLLGDCCGPGSAFDSHRQHVSTYAFDHYGIMVISIPKSAKIPRFCLDLWWIYSSMAFRS